MDCDDASTLGVLGVLDTVKDVPSSRVESSTAVRSTADVAMPSSPLTKTRSMSDGGAGTPSRGHLSPSPLLLDAATARPACRDDSSIGSSTVDIMAPATPRRLSSFQHRAMALQLPSGQQRQGLDQQGQQGQQQQDQQQDQKDQQDQQQQQSQSQQQTDCKQNKDVAPSTPVSINSSLLQQQQQQLLFLNQPTYMSKPIPLSPKLDPSQIYASPTNILPRRSRGLDFSRAATSLHHSTLAEQSSPDLSPTVSASRAAMNIPGRKPGDFGGATESSNSLWSLMGGRGPEKTYPSSSLGSVNYACSDSSSSSDDNDLMDEDQDEPFVTTPQVGRVSTPAMTPTSAGPVSTLPGSPAMNSLLSFQHRQRPRKQSKRKGRNTLGSLGLGFSAIGGSGSGSGSGARSPPSYILGRDSSSAAAAAAAAAHSRRESISWAANQLHISGSESDDNHKAQMEAGEGFLMGRDGQRGVVRRVVTRRGNLLPKTKGFARIRAALAEESAPVESDFRREAEVVRQVLESDMEPDHIRLPPLLPPPPPLRSTATTASSSPMIFDNLEDVPDDDMAMDASAGLGLSAGMKLPADKSQVRGRSLWAAFDPQNSAMARTTPPRQQPRGSSVDDISMDSPLGTGSGSQSATFAVTSSSSGNGTPQPSRLVLGPSQQQQQQHPEPSQPGTPGQPCLPSAAEITRRINSKRRRDDDLDPVSFKRRAVSPGMSVHNSPIMQSPLQRDVAPWGLPSSRPGSNGSYPEARFFPPLPGGSNSGMGPTPTDGSTGGNTGTGRVGSKGRVGYQTMADANDSITRLSIE